MQALAHWQHPSVAPQPKPPDPFAHLSSEPTSVKPNACAPAQPGASAPGQGGPQCGDIKPHTSLGSLASFPGDPFASPSHAQPAQDADGVERPDIEMHDGDEPDMASSALLVSTAEPNIPSSLDAAAAAQGLHEPGPDAGSDSAATTVHPKFGTVSMKLCCRPPAAVLLDALYWLAGYVDLWRRPCNATGLLLAADHGSGQLVPPYVRPFWLSSKKLQAAALDAAQRTAFHCHAVPPECFAARGL